VGDEDISKKVLKAARSSMGMDTSEPDMLNIVIFTDRMISLALYRKQLYHYLEEKMATVAPNLTFVPDNFDTSITWARANLSSSSAMRSRLRRRFFTSPIRLARPWPHGASFSTTWEC